MAAELWQQAISRLERVPNENPQYVDAQKLIASYQVKQKTVIDPRSTTLIAAAKQYALAAAQASQNPPHTVQKWEQIADLWKKAIGQLENVQVSETSYVEAQKLIAQYQTNLGTIQNRRQAESDAKEILDAANREIQSLIASPPSNNNEAKAEIIKVMNQLSNVKSGTTSYNEAQRLLKLADNQIKKLQ